MRRFIRPLIASAAFAVIAGCSDSTTGPRDLSTRALPQSAAPSFSKSSTSSSGTQTVTFTAAGGVYQFGNLFTLTVPANAVCTTASGYGPGTWDMPCTTLSGTQTVSITVVYGYNSHGPYINFLGDLRFSPSTTVVLSSPVYASLLTTFKAMWLANPAALGFLGIYYINSANSTLVADAIFDPSLVTHANLTTGDVWRRIKHLSGYNVTAGSCDSTDPTCVGVSPVIEQ